MNRDELADFLDELPKRPYHFASLQPEMMGGMASAMRKVGEENPLEGNAKSVWEALIELAEDIEKGKR